MVYVREGADCVSDPGNRERATNIKQISDPEDGRSEERD